MFTYQTLSKEWLIEEYCNKKRSARDIAKDFSCAITTINRQLRKHNIWKRAPKQIVANKILKKQRTNSAPSKARGKRWSYESAQRLKISAIDHYGNQCICCGETELIFLTIDHIFNNGNIHRKIIGTKLGVFFYRWLKNNNYPTGFQVLCWNCNEGKHINKGICPHKGIKRIFTTTNQEKGAQLKYEAQYKFGSQCICCEEKNYFLLTFDHINNDGQKWLKIHDRGNRMYKWILNRIGYNPKFTNYNPREIFQLLCWNCNEGKRLNGGICPHQSLNSNRFDFPLV